MLNWLKLNIFNPHLIEMVPQSACRESARRITVLGTVIKIHFFRKRMKVFLCCPIQISKDFLGVSMHLLGENTNLLSAPYCHV